MKECGDNVINFHKLTLRKLFSGFNLLILPLSIAGLVLLIICLLSLMIPNYDSFLFSVGDYTAFYGVCANISVTFIALLFAIASINIALQSSHKESNNRKLVTDGAYGLKLLIKGDLIRVSICTIILQVVILLVNYIAPIPNICQIPMMAFTIAIMVYSLWFTVNSVYYSIVQNNINPILQNNLLNTEGEISSVWVYPPTSYDVYTVKKTLYPSMYRLLTSRENNQIQDARKAGDYNKFDLITAWNTCFYNVLVDAKNNISEIAQKNKVSYLKTLKKESVKIKIKRDKYFNLFKPKIQAPDLVVEICLDYENQYQIGLLRNKGDEKEKELLESLLYLLHCCKLYAEDRQDERKLRHLFINRSKYKNLNDTFMYTQYGNLLYRLSSLESEQYKSEYLMEAKKMYNLAVAIDCDNSVARHNSDILSNPNLSS